MSEPSAPDYLLLPYAHGGPPGTGRLRTAPEDFVVREWLGFAADGDGDHWLLTVRKRGANTHWVAKQLGRLAQIHPRDVGFAGLKDRNAITEQAFTVPVRSAVADWSGVTGEGFEVIGAARHRRKLKRGALRANDFQIVVREFSGDAGGLAESVAEIAAHGVPNYFGPQRFGIDGGNLTRARRLFDGEIQIHDRLERGFALSAARASIFNAVLARRVADGTWNKLQAGDIANLSGSNSVFAVDAVDETLTQRCSVLDIHPTGPMWGKEPTNAHGATAALEQAVATEQASLATGLERAGLETQRRSLRLPVGNFEWTLSGDQLQLSFRLPRGAFATAVLHELLGNAFAQGGLSEQEED